MTEGAPIHDLAALRDRLLATYTADEFRDLFLYAQDPALRAVSLYPACRPLKPDPWEFLGAAPPRRSNSARLEGNAAQTSDF